MSQIAVGMYHDGYLSPREGLRVDKMPNGTDANDVVPLLVEALAQLQGDALMICPRTDPAGGQAHAGGLPHIHKSFS